MSYNITKQTQLNLLIEEKDGYAIKTQMLRTKVIIINSISSLRPIILQS